MLLMVSSQSFSRNSNCHWGVLGKSSGLAHRDLEHITAIGVDEVQWHRGHKYQTVVYPTDENQKRLLWIGPDRKAKGAVRLLHGTDAQTTSRHQSAAADEISGLDH